MAHGVNELYDHEGAFDASAIRDILASAGLLPTVYSGLTDALAWPGLAILTNTSVDACTLGTPLAGDQQTGGDDGSILTVMTTTAVAHTITTAANKLIGVAGTKHIATFSGTAGANITFVAWNGLWYVLGVMQSDAAPGVALT